MLEKMKEIIAEQLSVDADSITAVSYTHLFPWEFSQFQF